MTLDDKIETVTYRYPYVYDYNIVSISLYKFLKDDLIVTGIIDSIDFEKFKEEGTINEKNKNRNVQKWTNKQKENKQKNKTQKNVKTN